VKPFTVYSCGRGIRRAGCYSLQRLPVPLADTVDGDQQNPIVAQNPQYYILERTFVCDRHRLMGVVFYWGMMLPLSQLQEVIDTGREFLR